MKIGPISIIRTKELLALHEAIVEKQYAIDRMKKNKTLRSEIADRLLQRITFLETRLNRYENVDTDPTSVLRKIVK